MNADVQNYLAMYQTTQAYLKLSSAYCDYLGGIRWSGEDEGLVYSNGKIFVFCAALAEFLEGFSNSGRVIPFSCVLHWLYFLAHGQNHPHPDVRRLNHFFYTTRLNWRNAGALAAALSEGVPEVAQPPRLDHVCRRLRDRAFPIRWFTARFHESPGGGAEMPAIAPGDFERLISDRLAAYSDNDLQSWLANGRGPIQQDGAALAREVPRPRSLTGVLAALLLRPRLAGAETYVTRLVGALTLPPRRLTPQELPVGGYADMTTHGAVEHILPSQHALEELEFLRRFAERELLFFRREEPPAQSRQEMAVLIDQGVRTWGDVRLVLAAAALALGKQAAGRKLGFVLAGTSNAGRLLDPAQVDGETLGELIEASDLSLNPGMALEAALEQSPEGLRDVVLLTHPRNLREVDVLAAACRAGPRDRLFAVTLDEEGAAAVSEIRHGAPVPLRQFHVDFIPSKPPSVRPLPAESPTLWTGDVEPVPFPFRFGTHGSVSRFEFDHDGRWLLTTSGDGILHLWDVNGRGYEILPRPFFRDTLWNKIVALNDTDGSDGIYTVTGVAGGFVLAGVDHGRLVLFHYDVARCRCTAHDVGVAIRGFSCIYVRQCHVMIVTDLPHLRGFALDLSTGEINLAGDYRTTPRIKEAWGLAARGEVRLPYVFIRQGKMGLSSEYKGIAECHLDPATGTLSFRGAPSDWTPYTPMADGQPHLRHASISDAQASMDILALRATLADGSDRLMLLQVRAALMLREHVLEKKPRLARFALSRNGHWLAMECGPRIVVEKIEAPMVRTDTHAGDYSGESKLYLSKECFLLSLGKAEKHWHLVRWSGNFVSFYHEHNRGGLGALRRDAFREALRRWPVTSVNPRVEGKWDPWISYDPQRFRAVGGQDGLWIALDCFGQVTVFNRAGVLLCMFIAHRDRLAAWLPDGSRCGSPMLSGGTETAGVRRRLAHVLNAAKGVPGA
jgi:hypothetical protein